MANAALRDKIKKLIDQLDLAKSIRGFWENRAVQFAFENRQLPPNQQELLRGLFVEESGKEVEGWLKIVEETYLSEMTESEVDLIIQALPALEKVDRLTARLNIAMKPLIRRVSERAIARFDPTQN